MATTYLRDPDGGVNELKKAAQLGLLENAEPESDLGVSFPKHGFSSDLTNIPQITFGTIWSYMIDRVEMKKQLSTAKPLVKGYNFFKSGHVLFIGHLAQAGKHYLKSQVLPSMKKQQVYTCHIVFISSGNLSSSQCGCPAGVDGRCNHVTATLFAAAEYCKQRSELKNKPKSSIEELSCTSQKCKWNVPRERTGNVTPIANMTFIKHDYSKQKKKRKSGHDVRAPHQRTWPKEKVKRMLFLAKDYQEKSGKLVGWTHILPQDVGTSGKDTCSVIFNPDSNLITPEKEHPVSSSQIKERCEKVKRKLKFDADEAIDIEMATRGQASNSVWQSKRKYRITASKCYRVASMKPDTSPTKAIKEVLQYNPPYQSKNMAEGVEMEVQILEEYKALMHQMGHIDLAQNVRQCGLFISDEGFLGASPDALVDDPSLSDPEGLVEIKYIQMNDNETLCDALVRKRICTKNNSEIELNTSHQYYYQIQQQMYVTKRRWVDFVVKGSKSDEIYCKKVCFSEDFWNKVLPKLSLFFERWLLPEIAYPRVKFGLPKLDFTSL